MKHRLLTCLVALCVAALSTHGVSMIFGGGVQAEPLTDNANYGIDASEDDELEDSTMAQFVNIFDVDLQKPTNPVPLRQMVGEGDSNGLCVGARVSDNGVAVTLGGSCVGKVVRADGATVQLTGTIGGNLASVVLDQTSCAIEGPIQVAVCWVSGSNVTTLVLAYGSVVHTQTGNAIQPSTPLPDLTQLLAEIDQMRAATAAANAAAEKSVRYDTTQSLTAAQKTTARGNIDAISATDLANAAVRYDTTQSLTAAQKSTARGNIDAISVTDLANAAVRYDTTQSLTTAQKTTARGNIDAGSAADVSALFSDFAGAFSDSIAYTAGQYVTYTDGNFYRFTTNHAAGAWNSSHVVRVTAGGELTDLKSAAISYSGSIPTDADLNDYGENGYYGISAAVRDSIVNKPSDFTSGTGCLICMKGGHSGTNVTTQILFINGSGVTRFYERLINNSTHTSISGMDWIQIGGNIVQETGNNPYKIMSQKAVTDAINAAQHAQHAQRWTNKTIVCFGDSRTWYDGHEYNNKTKADIRGEICVGYQQQISGLLGATVISQGVSGNTSVQICDRIRSYDFTGVDAVLLEGGVNDFVKEDQVTIGSIVPIGSTFDTSTVYGAWQSAIEYIMTNYPSVKIYVDIPAIAWLGINDDVFPYATAKIKGEIAELYNIPYKDLYKTSGITIANRDYFYCDDTSLTNNWHLHFNDEGNAWLGAELAMFINDN